MASIDATDWRDIRAGVNHQVFQYARRVGCARELAELCTKIFLGIDAHVPISLLRLAVTYTLMNYDNTQEDLG